jgi:hypothetical protein
MDWMVWNPAALSFWISTAPTPQLWSFGRDRDETETELEAESEAESESESESDKAAETHGERNLQNFEEMAHAYLVHRAKVKLLAIVHGLLWHLLLHGCHCVLVQVRAFADFALVSGRVVLENAAFGMRGHDRWGLMVFTTQVRFPIEL